MNPDPPRNRLIRRTDGRAFTSTGPEASLVAEDEADGRSGALGIFLLSACYSRLASFHCRLVNRRRCRRSDGLRGGCGRCSGRDHPHHVLVEVIHDRAIGHFGRLESDAARINHRDRSRHLVPVAGEVKLVLVDLLAQQRSVRVEHGHLTDISLFVVLVDFFAGQGGAGNREILVLDLVALDVVGNDFDERVFALGLASVCRQQFGNFGSHAANWANQTVAGPVAFNRWALRRGHFRLWPSGMIERLPQRSNPSGKA